MKDYETLKPIVIDHGKSVYLYDIDGNEYINIVSSWWCNLLGHLIISPDKIDIYIDKCAKSIEDVFG